jgi:hypothetical protein
MIESLLSIASSLFSIGSAVHAWRSARSAKTSLHDLAGIRDELIGRHQIEELSQLQSNLRSAYDSIARFGRTASMSSTRGLDHVSACREVENALHTIQLSIQMSYDEEETLNKCVANINRLLPAFVKARHHAARQPLAIEIQDDLISLHRSLKKRTEHEIWQFTSKGD